MLLMVLTQNMADSSFGLSPKRQKLDNLELGLGHSASRTSLSVSEGEMSCKLPREINLVEFAECRAREIKALTAAVRDVGTGQRVHQKLPKHMRRRAMSHNVKRLPRRLRRTASWQMQEVKRNKRPSRCYRRRPKNLLSEYNRRQQETRWMETHIWHAKRFKMMQEWGCKIPYSPNDKSVRASYRATTQHCLLQDQSYYSCIELNGDKELIAGLERMTSPLLGPTFSAEMYMGGRREGELVLYKVDTYPYCAIGPVKFLWKPLLPDRGQASEDDKQHLWMWLHPAIRLSVIKEIVQLFNLSEVQNTRENGQCNMLGGATSEGAHGTDIKTSVDVCEKQSDEQEQSKTEKMSRSATTFTNGRITLNDLTFELLRYRLTGPLSQSVLAHALRVGSVESKHESDDPCWWEEIFKNPDSMEVHIKQTDLWSSIKSVPCPVELESQCVIGLTVTDPRLHLSQCKALPEHNDSWSSSAAVRDFSPEVCWSPLWIQDVRTKVKVSKLSDHQLNQRRSQQLVPGSEVKLGREESKVPLLLIHHGSASSAPSGWDVIIPSGWGMPFWLSFVYRGARVGGLVEMENTLAYSDQPCFPSNFPDTEAGLVYDCQIEEELRAKHQRCVPSKRHNYQKLGVAWFFQMPWQELVYAWCQAVPQTVEGADERFQWYVQRERTVLTVLSQALKHSTGDLESGMDSLGDKARNSIVRVCLALTKKGKAERYAMICLPTLEDIEKVKENPKYFPEEPIQKGTTKGTKNDQRSESNAFSMSVCSRKVIGFVCKGGFSFKLGLPAADGFCVLPGLVELIKNRISSVSKPLVLVRNIDSLVYRFADIKIN